jgi:hypothetical protein
LGIKSQEKPTYPGPVGVVRRDLLLFGEAEDALLEDELGLGGPHRCREEK